MRDRTRLVNRGAAPDESEQRWRREQHLIA
jgi:hypothetical protein